MEEIWKDIPGYEGLYKVSNFGIVKSIERFVPNKRYRNLGVMRVPERIKSIRRSSDGYSNVTLSKDGVASFHSLHRLVATIFVPNPECLPVVNHIDGNPRNNRADNLEWCTNQQNILHSLHVLKNPPNNHRAVRCVETGEVFYSGAEAARKYKVSGEGAHILDAARGVRETCAGLHWEYINNNQ